MNSTEGYKKSISLIFIAITGLITVVILLNGICSPSFAKSIEQRRFATPEDAVNALVAAVRADDYYSGAAE